jgi:hypothetical protein
MRSFSEKVERMQAISHHVNKGEGEMKTEIISSIKSYLDKKGYRADLCLVSRRKPVANQVFPVEIRYNAKFEYPSERDLMALVAESFNGYEIDWGTAQVDTNDGLVALTLKPAVEIIPVANIKEIPPEFVAIGTGLFKRKANASGDVMEIWELKKDGNNLSLTRKMDDMDITAKEDEEFKAGDAVETPEGVGRILRFDDVGNALVQIGSLKRLVAKDDIRPYKMNDEKAKLVQYFTEAYGDADFARSLVEEHGDAAARRKKM